MTVCNSRSELGILQNKEIFTKIRDNRQQLNR